MTLISTNISSDTEVINALGYYLSTGTILTTEELDAIDFYISHKYISNFFFDIAQVVEYTEYQFDKRILDIDIDDFSEFIREIDNFDVLHLNQDSIERYLGRILSEDELEVYEIYRDYAKHYIIYRNIQMNERQSIFEIDYDKYDIALELLIFTAQHLEDDYEYYHQINKYYNENYQIDFMKYNDPNLVEEIIDRELTVEENNALEYINNIHGYKNEEYYIFINRACGCSCCFIFDLSPYEERDSSFRH